MLLKLSISRNLLGAACFCIFMFLKWKRLIFNAIIKTDYLHPIYRGLLTLFVSEIWLFIVRHDGLLISYLGVVLLFFGKLAAYRIFFFYCIYVNSLLNRESPRIKGSIRYWLSVKLGADIFDELGYHNIIFELELIFVARSLLIVLQFLSVLNFKCGNV